MSQRDALKLVPTVLDPTRFDGAIDILARAVVIQDWYLDEGVAGLKWCHMNTSTKSLIRPKFWKYVNHPPRSQLAEKVYLCPGIPDSHRQPGINYFKDLPEVRVALQLKIQQLKNSNQKN